VPTTFSFTLKVVDAEGREALLPDSITVLDDLPTGNVALSPRTIVSRGETPQGVSRTIDGSITLSPSLALSTSDGQSSTWGSGVTPADYEVRFTPAGGAAFTGSATGAWLSLAAERSWTEQFTAACADGDPDTQITTGTLEIRDVATSTVQTSATITFDQQITPIVATIRLSDRTILTRYTGFSASQPASTVAVVFFQNDGKLITYRNAGGVGSGATDPAEPTEIPNEWGVTLVASAFEIRFTPLADGGLLTPSNGWNTWVNAALNVSVTSIDTAPGDGQFFNTTRFRADIRPVGGATVASAEFTINHNTSWYSTGIIP
jgi:hypothetical protein